MGGDRAKGGKHGRVNGYGVVHHIPNDLLDEGDGMRCQESRFVGVIDPLDRLAIRGCLPGMGGILGASWRWMLELVEGGREVVGHGDVASSSGAVPG